MSHDTKQNVDHTLDKFQLQVNMNPNNNFINLFNLI